MAPHILDLPDGEKPAPPEGSDAAVAEAFLDGALVNAGAMSAENRTENSPETAAGASAPLSEPALASAPRDEEGPLVSEADPTSNAG